MRERAWVLALVAACGNSESPPPKPEAPKPVPEVAKTEALGQREALDRYHGLAVKITPPVDGEIPAIGPCTRPDKTAVEAISASIAAWAKAHNSDETGDPVVNAVGCVEASGLIVNAQMDVRRGKDDHETHGYWWALRVSGAKVTVLADAEGAPLTSFMEWTQEHTLDVVGLADLDGDGKLDAVIEDAGHEGGSMRSDIALSVVTASGANKALASFGDHVEMVGATVPMVLRIQSRDSIDYRCVDKALAFGACDAAATKRARAADRAEQIAALTGLPDRDQLADDLELFDVPAAERAALLASTYETTPNVRAARHIAQFVRARDGDLLPMQRAAKRMADAKDQTEALRVALGDAPCDAVDAKAAEAKATKWIAANDKTTKVALGVMGCGSRGDSGCTLDAPSNINVSATCAGAAGTYYAFAWDRTLGSPMEGMAHEAVVFSPKTGADVTLLEGAVDGLLQDAPAMGPRASPDIQALFYKRGAAIVAATTNDKHTLVVFADGKKTGSLDTPVTWSGPLLRTEKGDGAYTLFHADPEIHEIATIPGDVMSATQKAGTPGRLVLDAAQADAAWDLLGGVGDTVGDVPTTVRALTVAKAPKALVDEVSALR